jgi:hypothetical protein
MDRTATTGTCIRTGILVLLGVSVAGCAASTTASSGQSASTTATATATDTAPASQSPTAATTSALTDPTSGWVSYTSVANHFTVKHPASWNLVDCSTKAGGMNSSVALGPPLNACNPDIVGRVMLSSSAPAPASFVARSNETKVQHTDVVVDGIHGRRTSAVAAGQYQGKIVYYEFIAHSRYYYFAFYANMGPSSTGLTSDDFDQLVQTVTFS